MGEAESTGTVERQGNPTAFTHTHTHTHTHTQHTKNALWRAATVMMEAVSGWTVCVR